MGGRGVGGGLIEGEGMMLSSSSSGVAGDQVQRGSRQDISSTPPAPCSTGRRRARTVVFLLNTLNAIRNEACPSLRLFIQVSVTFEGFEVLASFPPFPPCFSNVLVFDHKALALHRSFSKEAPPFILFQICDDTKQK